MGISVEGEFRSDESSNTDNPPDNPPDSGTIFLGCHVRKAIVNDIFQLTKIENQSFCVADYPISEKLFRIMINNRKIAMFVAVCNGQVVGYVCFLVHKLRCLIYSIAVDEAHRGLGIGKKLLETVEKNALDFGAEKVSLEVRCDNNAVKLYQRFGYTVKDIKRNYYSDGGDAFHMEKSLAPNRGDLFGTSHINAERCPQTIN